MTEEGPPCPECGSESYGNEGEQTVECARCHTFYEHEDLVEDDDSGSEYSNNTTPYYPFAAAPSEYQEE